MASIESLTNSKETHDEFIRSFMSSLAFVSKASNTIPVADDYTYFSTFRDFVRVTNDTTVSAGEMIQNLLGLVNASKSAPLPGGLLDPALYDQIVDTIDMLLDDADRKFEIAGETSGQASKIKVADSVRSTLAADKNRLLHGTALEIKKPQHNFDQDIYNFRDKPFAPKLKEKFHYTVPLDIKQIPNASTGAVSSTPYASTRLVL